MQTPSLQTSIVKSKLYRQYVKGKYSKYNKERIDWVLKNVYKKQISRFNYNENKVITRLYNKGIQAESQKILPVLSEGGKIEHLYIADIVVGTTIIEVDGPQHENTKEYDNIRDQALSNLGYTTIRIPTSDLSTDTIDNYLQQLYK